MLCSYSEIERLLRNRKIYVEFKYAWHSSLQRTLRLNKDEGLKKVEDCLKHGANPSNRGSSGVTALMLTREVRDHERLIEVLRYSPAAEQVDAASVAEQAVAEQAVAEQVVSLLLDHGAEVNQQDFYGRTALHHVFSYENSLYFSEERLARIQRVVQILIQHNADIYLKDSSGLSAFDMAKRRGYDSWLRTDEASLTGTLSKKGKTC
jgi:ankyrin repeat protein